MQERERGAVRLLAAAMAYDLAERIQSLTSFEPVVFEPYTTSLAELVPAPERVQQTTQVATSREDSLVEAVRSVYLEREGSELAVFLRCSPLYPVEVLKTGMELLQQEDDVVVVGESPLHEVSWIGTKSYHPELYVNLRAHAMSSDSLLESIPDLQALVMPVRGARSIESVDDLPFLSHEVERQLLLRRWVPPRTYEVLRRLKKLRLLPEIA